ncbi:MAG: hypothetical protein HFI64_15310 [Lachnospiraceae bacterium]|nr:hypothetical protein [Lachnospiraceae bacterium]
MDSDVLSEQDKADYRGLPDPDMAVVHMDEKTPPYAPFFLPDYARWKVVGKKSFDKRRKIDKDLKNV